MALSSITAIYSASDTLPCDVPANTKETTYNRADENRLRNPHKFTLEKVCPSARRLTRTTESMRIVERPQHTT